MRFLADEGCDPALLALLRELGHDVAAVAEIAPASTDEAILAWGLREKRLILHYDLDFGTLIFRDQLPTYGVILVRIADSQPDLRSTRLQELLQRYDESRLAGSITRLTPKRITMTPIGTQLGNKQRKAAISGNKHHTSTVIGKQQPVEAEIGVNPPKYEDWKPYALSFDGESLCRQMAIRPTAWYAQQTRNY